MSADSLSAIAFYNSMKYRNNFLRARQWSTFGLRFATRLDLFFGQPPASAICSPTGRAVFADIARPIPGWPPLSFRRIKPWLLGTLPLGDVTAWPGASCANFGPATRNSLERAIDTWYGKAVRSSADCDARCS